MMRFPSQMPRSPFSRMLRIGIVATSLTILIASLVGFAYALWPAKEFGASGYADTPTATAVGLGTEDIGMLGAIYGNGKIPASELVEIAPGRKLIPEAAERFTRMKKALQRDGHELQVNSAYRTLSEQEGLIKRHGLLSDGGTAAPVGESDHGLGLSVDLKLDGDALRWMESRAGSFGFRNTVRGEPWHWTYGGSN
ncbi:D-alanyl-D-alanine carboxypeptidase family protein [Paeniglutamicibacter sp. NPDC012692]|uniref:M15 family metallopeptidase n=1 Tax=Paeniglutamicibacter sp. NPDC012692 TaxID=3364388 RepID=UPI00367CD19D